MQIKAFTKCSWLAVIIVIVISQASFTNSKVKISSTSNITKTLQKTDSSQWFLYDSLQLQMKGLSKEAYNYALLGYNKLMQSGKLKNNETLTIIDFSLPSTAKRLFVIDMKVGEILFNTLVSHGRNSGKDMANDFSNNNNSFKSSLGFYLTSETYIGKHGLSMRLEGEEKGINDNAISRGIVMHSAEYVNEALIRSQGYIG
ncbi:MAG: murein L,D-transpeptidase catalytic domain family protein, partial [Deinococcales bacterium]|nr:murein L,D-transpeptidase catalytic domain family protein [Chitinophagaceae bacterium]